MRASRLPTFRVGSGRIACDRDSMKKVLSKKSLDLRPETVRSLTRHELTRAGGAGNVMLSGVKDGQGQCNTISCIMTMPTAHC
jgi:hypothetical protein